MEGSFWWSRCYGWSLASPSPGKIAEISDLRRSLQKTQHQAVLCLRVSQLRRCRRSVSGRQCWHLPSSQVRRSALPSFPPPPATRTTHSHNCIRYPHAHPKDAVVRPALTPACLKAQRCEPAHSLTRVAQCQPPHFLCPLLGKFDSRYAELKRTSVPDRLDLRLMSQ